MRQQCRKVTESPPVYRCRQELGPHLRSCPYGHFVLFFLCCDDVVTIVRILHEARDVGPHFDV
ncbi:type II toxin-antitoxin system RelE/ParE family toxin [Pseudomonas asplenii]|uniref:type II toxin-antitoxin system RelE/ParE family toxin n=1 Tax=Pseudomonas asplenii TaxID=53407 RepID=UPI0037C51703